MRRGRLDSTPKRVRRVRKKGALEEVGAKTLGGVVVNPSRSLRDDVLSHVEGARVGFFVARCAASVLP